MSFVRQSVQQPVTQLYTTVANTPVSIQPPDYPPVLEAQATTQTLDHQNTTRQQALKHVITLANAILHLLHVSDKMHPVGLTVIRDMCSMLRDLGENPSTYELEIEIEIQPNQFMAAQSAYLYQTQHQQMAPNPLLFQYFPRQPITVQHT